MASVGPVVATHAIRLQRSTLKMHFVATPVFQSLKNFQSRVNALILIIKSERARRVEKRSFMHFEFNQKVRFSFPHRYYRGQVFFRIYDRFF